MSNLDQLTAKILADSKAKADAIAAEAAEKARQHVAAQEAEANRERDRILAEAEGEAKHAAEQLVLGKTLAIRDQNLEARQQMLDKVFAAALERLNAMSKEELLAFARDYLSGMDPDGEEIFFPPRYGVTSIDEINEHLRKQGKKGNLKLGDPGNRTIDGGFILAKNGIEQNNTFASLVEFHRYDLEAEVLRELYP